jgi:hypothetical protein
MLTVVAEEILGKGMVDDVAKLIRHLQVGFDINAEPLEFVGGCGPGLSAVYPPSWARDKKPREGFRT